MVALEKLLISEEIMPQIDHIEEVCERIRPLVVTSCATYNQELYLRDALEGFVMQKTDFPFVAIVHDDASTDGTAAILRDFAEKYPDIILPIYETENQYSKKDGSLTRILNYAKNLTGAKYVALCEGDDYWIDPLKLQKQVDIMQSNEEISMCVTNAVGLKATDKSKVCEYEVLKDDGVIPFENIVLDGGGSIATCTIMYKLSLYENRPDEIRNLYVGDYPLQMYMGLIGKVFYLNYATAVYRIGSIGSFTVNCHNIKYEDRIKFWPEQVKIYRSFKKISGSEYHNIFEQAELHFLFDENYRYKKFSECRKYWFKMDNPFKRYGLTVCFEIFNLKKLSKILHKFRDILRPKRTNI